MAKVRVMTVPVLLLINKIDLMSLINWFSWLKNRRLLRGQIIPISAASKFNVDYIMKRIKDLLGFYFALFWKGSTD